MLFFLLLTIYTVQFALELTQYQMTQKSMVGLSGRSLRRTLRAQVVAEGLAHPLVAWSTLAPDVFPAWSTAWFTIPRKEDREHRANSGYSRAILVVFENNRPSPSSSLSPIAHHTDDRSLTIKLFSKKNCVHLFCGCAPVFVLSPQHDSRFLQRF